MADVTILFIPWAKSLGVSVSEGTTFANNIVTEDSGRVHLKNPERSRSPDGGEYRLKNEKWIEAAKQREKTVYEVWYSGSMSIMLLALTGNSQIYVRGHCTPGSPKIFTKSTGNPDGNLQFNEVADRLIDTGLDVDFSGKVKCYNCHSAEGGIEAFAQLFADYMYQKGYKKCTYYGYEGALDSLGGGQLNASVKGNGHKHSTAGGRASKFRKQVIPKGVKDKA